MTWACSGCTHRDARTVTKLIEISLSLRGNDLHWVSLAQCDQIGRFLKVAQMLSDFLGLPKTSFSTKAWSCNFLGNFWKTKLGYFLFQHLVTLFVTHLSVGLSVVESTEIQFPRNLPFQHVRQARPLGEREQNIFYWQNGPVLATGSASEAWL